MNLYKREIYKKSLQHAERRNHKYLYKIGDRYIYPEDVAGKAKSTASNIGSMATAAGTAAKTKISNTIADQKQKHKDKKFVKKSNPGQSNEYYNASRIERDKRNEESYRRYINSPEYKQGEYNRKASEIGDEEAYKRMVASNRPGRRKSSELEKQKLHTAAHKAEKEEKIRKRKEKTSTQIKSAHTYDGGRSDTPGYRKAIHDTNVRKMKNPKTAAEAERRLASEHDHQSVYWAKQRIEVDRPYRKQDKNFSKVETKTVVNNPVKNKSVEVKDTSVKPITIKENTLKENVIRENTDKGFNKGLTMTESERFRRGYTVSKKPKKKKTKAQRRSELTGQR